MNQTDGIDFDLVIRTMYPVFQQPIANDVAFSFGLLYATMVLQMWNTTTFSVKTDFLCNPMKTMDNMAWLIEEYIDQRNVYMGRSNLKAMVDFVLLQVDTNGQILKEYSEFMEACYSVSIPPPVQMPAPITPETLSLSHELYDASQNLFQFTEKLIQQLESWNDDKTCELFFVWCLWLLLLWLVWMLFVTVVNDGIWNVDWQQRQRESSERQALFAQRRQEELKKKESVSEKGKKEECGICYDQEIDCILPCGHSFCYECVTKWRDRAILLTAACPYCQARFSYNNIKPINAETNVGGPTYFPSRYLSSYQRFFVLCVVVTLFVWAFHDADLNKVASF